MFSIIYWGGTCPAERERGRTSEEKAQHKFLKTLMPGKQPPYSELEGDQVYIPFKPNSIFTTNFCPNSPGLPNVSAE